MVHHLVATALLEEVLMDLEVDTALQEAVMVLEVVSVAAHLLLDGTVEDAAVTVPRVLDLADHLHLDMVQTLTTALKVAWRPSNDSVPLPCRISLLAEDLRPAVARLSARLSRWTNVMAAHQMRHLIKFLLMV
jgi:hypothetical protein